MSFSVITRERMTRRRWFGLVALAAVTALALALVIFTRADAQQPTPTTVSVNPSSAVVQTGGVFAMGITVAPAASGVQIRYRIISGPNEGETGVANTGTTGLVVFSYPGDEGVGTDAILIWADLDRDGFRDGTEPLTAAIVEWVSVAGTSIQIEPSASSGALGGAHSVTATVSPAKSGVIVRFEVPSGPNVGDAAVLVTNSSGRAVFSYVGDGGLGTDTITAWPDFDGDGTRESGEPQVTATRLWTSGSSSGVAVEPFATTEDVGDSHTVHATLSPAQGGLFMRFEVTSGPNAGSRGVALSSTAGRATYTYVGRGGDGIDLIAAWADLDKDGFLDSDEPHGQASVSWGTGDPNRTISALPTSSTNRIGTFHSVTATANPATSGLVIRFRVVSGPHTGATGRVLTDGSGRATYSYLGSAVGTDSIRAWIDADDDGVLDTGEPRVSVSKFWTTAPVAQSITLLPSTHVSLIGTNHTLTATVGPARSGAVVRFLVSMGPNRGDSGVGVTNSQGQVKFSYLGNGGVGTDAIVTWIDLNSNGVRETNEPHRSAIQQWVGAQANAISAAPQDSSGAVGTQHTVTATVSPLASNVLVRFRVTQGPNIGRTGSASTNGQGRAAFSYIGSGGAGADLVLVWADFNGNGALDSGEPQAAVVRSWVAVAGSGFSLSPPTDTNPANTRHNLTATVAPAQRNLLVRFEVTAGPNAGIRGADDTNSNGRADLSYVGTGGVGTDVILGWLDFDRDGRIDAGEPQAVATKQWTAPVVTSIRLAPSGDTNPVNTRHEVVATVSPAQRDLLVRFEVTDGPNRGKKGTDGTNSNGRADFSYVGDRGTGTDIIRAWVDLDRDGRIDSGEPQAIATKQWTAPTVTSIQLAPSGDTNPVNTRHEVVATVGPAQRDLLVRFEVTAGPNEGKRGSDGTNSNGRADFSYVGDRGTGTDIILAWVDRDRDGRIDSDEPQAIATKQWTAPVVTSVTLKPSGDTNPVNTRHEVVATVSPAQRDLLVRFEVTSGPNQGKRGSDGTNSEGRADFSYVGDHGSGTDIILAWVDRDRDGRIDSGEPKAIATKQWVAPVATSIRLSPENDVNPVNSRHELTATINPVQRDVLVRFEVTSGPNAGKTGKDTTDSKGRARFSYVGDHGVGEDVIIGWADLDRDGRIDEGEPQAIAIKRWIEVAATAIEVDPDFSRAAVGSSHQIKITVTPAIKGELVRFQVIEGPNTGAQDRERTDANGEATLGYPTYYGAGIDRLLVWVDRDEDGKLDNDEPRAEARVEWHTEADPRAQAQQVCDNLDRYTHPSLPTLCRLIDSGQLSDRSEGVIIGVILKHAGFEDHDHGYDKEHDDDDD